MSALLSVSDAHVSYGKVEAVRSVSLDVADNEIVTIIGANGAGKSTLLNAVMGVLPLKGTAAFAGRTWPRSTSKIASRQGLCLVPEHRELFGTMSVEAAGQRRSCSLGENGVIDLRRPTGRRRCHGARSLSSAAAVETW